MIELGSYVRDVITNFSGRVTGKCEYLTGCRQYLVQPALSETGEFRQGMWLDEDRLEVARGREVLALPLRTANGPDIAPPIW